MRRLSVPISKRDNVATFTLAPGTQAYQAFIQKCGLENEDGDPLVFDANLVSDDEATTISHQDHVDWNDELEFGTELA